MIRRFLCRLFGHALPPGVTRRFSISFECARCRNVVPGDIGRR